jgi:UDP-N-acetylglucosamine 2-epimerase (non-hydrolysing)
MEHRLVHTGQHYDIEMSDQLFRELDLPVPDRNLGVGSASHARQTAEVMSRFDVVCEEERPDWVVVVGDVNSTLACALVAVKRGLNVAHVEAGLRSFDRSMPEEINRVLTDAVAELLFTPSADADENLKREGIPEERIRRVGNIMIDALVVHREKASHDNVGKRLGLEPGAFVYVTLHRPANVDDRERLSRILSCLEDLARTLPVVFPMHPRTKKQFLRFAGAGNPDGRVKMTDPVGYHASLWLAENARLVLTDSGGLQEETTFFRTPCLTLRASTERPVTVTLGSNRLTRVETLRTDVDVALKGPRRTGTVPPLWDGQTAERIARILVESAP